MKPTPDAVDRGCHRHRRCGCPGCALWRFVGVIAMTIKGHLPRRAVGGSVDTGRVPTADPVVNVVTGVR